MTKLHALLVGIDSYKSTDVKPLSACVNDVRNLSEYLTSALSADYEILTLTNEKATKKGLESAIRKFFLAEDKEISEDDTLLFYFSGHGCQETADPRWKERDNFLEALVCHDSLANGVPPFADKELRYLFHLIWQKTKAQIVMITDACNSGSVSRDLNHFEKRLGPQADIRKWDQFLFANPEDEREPGIPESVLESSESVSQLPQGTHIHMSACESFQTAYERPGHQGIFTERLLKVLRQAQGSISYQNLHDRIIYEVREEYRRQTPTLYAHFASEKEEGRGAERRMKNRDFLTHITAERKQSAFAKYDYQKKDWMLYLGLIHGLPSTQQEEGNSSFNKIELTLLDLHTRTPLFKGSIEEVGINSSTFVPVELEDPEEYAYPEKEPTYLAEVRGIYRNPLPLYLEGDTDLIQKLKNSSDEMFLSDYNIQWVSDEKDASYKLMADRTRYKLCLANEPENLPICKNIDIEKSDAQERLEKNLKHISRWHFVKGLHNPTQASNLSEKIHWQLYWQPATGDPEGVYNEQKRMTEQSFDLQQKEDGSPHIHALDHPTLSLELPKTANSGGNTPLGFLRVRIRNMTSFPIYVSLLYLGNLFEIDAECIESETEVVALEGGGELWGLGDEVEGSQFHIYDHNKERHSQNFFLKLLFSTAKFDLHGRLSQTGLLAPGSEDFKDGLQETILKEAALELDDWQSKMVGIHLINPAV